MKRLVNSQFLLIFVDVFKIMQKSLSLMVTLVDLKEDLLLLLALLTLLLLKVRTIYSSHMVSQPKNFFCIK